MGTHLFLDFLSGALLGTAPFLLLAGENNPFRTALIVWAHLKYWLR